MNPAVYIKQQLMGFMVSDTRRSIAHFRGRLKRRSKPVVYYFHQVNDPYSHIADQKLDQLRDRYAVDFISRWVSMPEAVFQGDSSRFRNWALRDAKTVAPFYGADLPDDFANTPPQRLEETDAGNRLRKRLGHYLSGTFYFEGEWYWGLDRLFHLENRLISSGLSWDPDSICVPRPEAESATGVVASYITLEYFPSLRSPYSAISYDRTIDLANRSGVTLKLRPVMPMMMRGVPAPRAKQFYIMTDAKREADYYGIPFGNIVDPFGEPVKRAFALFPYMREIGRDVEYCSNFLRAAWAEGINITTDAGLKSVVTESGGNWKEAMKRNDDWQSLLDNNVTDMLNEGLWGVPSFRVSGVSEEAFSCWGQDRLWRVETEISRRAKSGRPESRNPAL